ncbi:MAG: Gfo/Idh/MocA family oxidoreductase, partial [Planctomyces sp.]
IRARGKEDGRGGAEDLWVLGTHVLDLMRALGGEPEHCYAELFHQGQRVRGEHVREGNEGLGPLAGDRVDAMYRFRGGITGYFSSRRGAGGNPNRFGLRVLGTKGVIEHTSGYGNPAWLLKDARWGGPGVNGAAGWQSISSQGLGQPEVLTATGYEGGNPAAALDLMESIRQNRQPKCSMYEARGAVELVLAAFESHVQGGPVQLPLQTRDNALSRLPR